MNPIGHKVWAIPGGRMPLRSTGPEPDFTSRDELCILNTAATDAELEITTHASFWFWTHRLALKPSTMRWTLFCA